MSDDADEAEEDRDEAREDEKESERKNDDDENEHDHEGQARIDDSDEVIDVVVVCVVSELLSSLHFLFMQSHHGQSLHESTSRDCMDEVMADGCDVM